MLQCARAKVAPDDQDLFQRKVPGAAGQTHRVLAGVGHFIQEDAGEELGRITAAFALPSSAQRNRH
jgi:haloalkane dehalogenase